MVIDTTDIVAWWGAVIGTVILLWDIYKWRTAGARLRMSVSTGMLMIKESYWDTTPDDKLHIVVKLSNYGDRSTTITHLIFKAYPTWFARLLDRPEASFIANNPSPGQPIPYELMAGGIWTGVTDQSPDFEKFSVDSHLIAEVVHSHSTKSVTARIVIRQKKQTPGPQSAGNDSSQL